MLRASTACRTCCPENYQQTVSAAGFETAIRNGIILTVGAQMVSNVEMKVGAINESVEVSDQPPDLQLESSAISSSTILKPSSSCH